ncbi:MAG: hydroxymethylpyrimidine/phosphomethylpyrimidine kinase, partial [Deltaproteobacteria bacterium]|nr:hydroxymethylpyrimidine/phosphomethylpyrimidine kinase [Deltaproteobacteria bacterium]
RIDAVKIGMLGSSSNARAMARVIRRKGLENCVLDPVLRSTGGYPLMDCGGVEAIKALLKLAAAVTPNLREARLLSGVRIKDLKDMESAALNIHLEGARNVIVKGGHLKGAPVDVLYDGKRFYHFEGKRIKGRKEIFHGTGCMFSSAIAAGLAKGLNVRASVEGAKRYVEKILRGRRL